MEEAITCRPADLIPNELEKMAAEAKENGGDGSVEDTLTYAMFPKVAPKFFKERSKGPVSSDSFVLPKASSGAQGAGGSYTVTVNGSSYNVVSGPAGDTMNVTVNGTSYNVSFAAPGAQAVSGSSGSAGGVVSAGAVEVKAPVAGTLLKVLVADGAQVASGQTVMMIESMKMELEVKASAAGPIHFKAAAGNAITAGQVLAVIGDANAAPVQAPSAPVQAPPAAQSPSGGAVVNAPVAGTYLKNTVAEGSAVTAGQTIIMIESMKMELEIKAASAGTVHFLVSPGSAITAGQALAEIK